jgi:predicted nucleotidyltransferase
MSGLSPAQKKTITALAARHDVASVRVFGSMARGTASAGSDLDLLVRFKTPATLLRVIGFKQAVEEALHRKVDVVEEGGISPHLSDRILSEAVAI